MFWRSNTQTWCTDTHMHKHTAAARYGRLLDICECIQSQSCGAFCITIHIIAYSVHRIRLLHAPDGVF